LAAFYKALAESKSSTDKKAPEARAQAAWTVYQLASLRPATKENLRQLLLEAKNGAPESSVPDDAIKSEFPTQVRIEKSLAQLDEPLPGRVRIPQASECRLASKAQPQYPAAAKTGRIQGDVLLKVVVSRNGEVIEVTPLSGEPILVAASVAAVKQWRYRPYYLAGQPVEFEFQTTLKFALVEAE
jgi:TonB family protein